MMTVRHSVIIYYITDTHRKNKCVVMLLFTLTAQEGYKPN